MIHKAAQNLPFGFNIRLCKQLCRCDSHFLDSTKLSSTQLDLTRLDSTRLHSTHAIPLSSSFHYLWCCGAWSLVVAWQVWGCEWAMNKIINETSFSTRNTPYHDQVIFKLKFPHWSSFCKVMVLMVLLLLLKLLLCWCCSCAFAACAFMYVCMYRCSCIYLIQQMKIINNWNRRVSGIFLI